MCDVLVLGGGICGLGTAMMLARDGHDVTVVERDTEAPPDDPHGAATSWSRPGVAQFRQAHYMHARFRHVLEAELPDVADALVADGALKYDLLNKLFPPTISDTEPRPGDDRYWALTGRRGMVESVFARKAEAEPRVHIRRGTAITGLEYGNEAVPGVPNVVGARTMTGEFLKADVVVDATGRASKLPEWLEDVGGRPPHEEAEDCGFTYYGQYFRSRDGTLPDPKGTLLHDVGTISVLTLPSDNDTWMVVVWMASGDQPLKKLRFWDRWTQVVRAIPAVAHWIDGERIGDLECMSGIMDRYRRFVVDGKPVVTGLYPVADAWASTNPSLGRGISLGMWHASLLRKHLRDGNGDPKSMAEGWDATTEDQLTPWYQAQIAMDRARVAQMNALRENSELPPADDPVSQMAKAFLASVGHDADMFRAFLEVMGCLATPEEVLSRPGVFEKMLAAAGDKEPLSSTAGPTREELLKILA